MHADPTLPLYKYRVAVWGGRSAARRLTGSATGGQGSTQAAWGPRLWLRLECTHRDASHPLQCWIVTLRPSTEAIAARPARPPLDIVCREGRREGSAGEARQGRRKSGARPFIHGHVAQQSIQTDARSVNGCAHVHASTRPSGHGGAPPLAPPHPHLQLFAEFVLRCLVLGAALAAVGHAKLGGRGLDVVQGSRLHSKRERGTGMEGVRDSGGGGGGGGGSAGACCCRACQAGGRDHWPWFRAAVGRQGASRRPREQLHAKGLHPAALRNTAALPANP